MYYQNLFINEASSGEKTSRKCDFFKLLIILIGFAIFACIIALFYSSAFQMHKPIAATVAFDRIGFCQFWWEITKGGPQPGTAAIP